MHSGELFKERPSFTLSFIPSCFISRTLKGDESAVYAADVTYDGTLVSQVFKIQMINYLSSD